MNFQVIWNPSAIDDLANIWNAATDRNTVASASNLIDRALARDPINIGESRFGGQRVIYEDPLGARYEVVLDDRRVCVAAVWLTRLA